MRITFVLPSAARVPAGGYKVIYEYANHLSDRGHSVTVIHPAQEYMDEPLSRRAIHAARYVVRRLTDKFGPER
jgi:glycogen synthase